jgi:hypothetical protein
MGMGYSRDEKELNLRKLKETVRLKVLGTSIRASITLE